MDVTRIDAYDDQRFSQKALLQHGAFLMDDIPAEVVITGSDTAVVRCPVPDAHDALIDEFRFYAEHITRFTDEAGLLLRAFPPVERFSVALDDIQPSQFYADEDKLRAVRGFIKGPFLKYLFYFIYPAHIFVIYLIKANTVGFIQ